MAVRSLMFVLGVLLLLAAPGARDGARAGEAILMPFSCAVKNGKPTLNSAAPMRYDIIGERRAREYRACNDKDGRDCRTMQVYSFDVNCQGVRAPWYELAAQIRSNDVGLSWIEKGELNLLLKKSTASATDRQMARYVVQKGYAPIDELGVRIVTGAAGNDVGVVAPAGGGADAERAAQQPVAASAANGSRVIVPTIDNAAVLTPVAIREVAFETAPASDEWQAVVTHDDPADEGVGPVGSGEIEPVVWLAQGQNLAIAMFILAATSLLAAFGWYGRRHAAVSPGTQIVPVAPEVVADADPEPANRSEFISRMAGAAGGVGAKLHSRWVGFKWRRLKAGKPWEWSNASIANGARSAEALYEKAENAVRVLGPASSLRDTLSAELKGVRQRLDGLRGGSGEKPKTARVAASLRAVVRDLERIGRIAESAAVSVKGSSEKIVMPRTRAEAFEVLGVNANVTEGALKRIVDALRMGWHPDHAQDEIDKRLREERTKQINIAWDLIAGKRIA